MNLLTGRVIFVSGSTRGIGRAMAEAYASEGATVVVNGRRQADAERVARDLPGALAVGADLSQKEAIEDAVKRVKAELGTVDVLVNNAGISVRGAFTRLSDQDWERVIQVNLTGSMLLTRAVVPLMKAQGGGSIINLISGAATSGSVGYSAYAASKGGLLGLTMTLAAELSRFGIRVNALSPSALTDMLRENPAEVLEPMIDKLPSLEAVAGAAVFLASDLAAAVTGQIIRATDRFAPYKETVSRVR